MKPVTRLIVIGAGMAAGLAASGLKMVQDLTRADGGGTLRAKRTTISPKHRRVYLWPS